MLRNPAMSTNDSTPLPPSDQTPAQPRRGKLPPTRQMQLPKPERPVKGTPGYPADFPLFPHRAGVWAKKIKGKMCYFGPWSDPAGALARYQAERASLESNLDTNLPGGDG